MLCQFPSLAVLVMCLSRKGWLLLLWMRGAVDVGWTVVQLLYCLLVVQSANTVQASCNAFHYSTNSEVLKGNMSQL